MLRANLVADVNPLLTWRSGLVSQIYLVESHVALVDVSVIICYVVCTMHIGTYLVYKYLI